MKIKTYNERLENETPVSTTEILMRTPAQTESQLGKKVKWKALKFIQKQVKINKVTLFHHLYYQTVNEKRPVLWGSVALHHLYSSYHR